MTTDPSLIVRQLFDAQSSTYTYILADPQRTEAVIIDPVLDQIDRDLRVLEQMGLTLKFCLETHIHADHLTGGGELRQKTGAMLVYGYNTKCACAEVLARDNDEIKFGHKTLTVIETPGHTNGCVSYYIDGFVFTGDTLLIGSCGRTDLQEGSPETLFDSVHKKLYKLPPRTIVYPAHDYQGHTSSTLEEEMKYNTRIPLNQKKEDFVDFMTNLKLPLPKKIEFALPTNRKCGDYEYDEIVVQDLRQNQNDYVLVDVRTPKEYEEGHIKGTISAPLGSPFLKYLESADKNKSYVFICKSGRRSNVAAGLAKDHKFKKALNLKGGMMDWIDKGYPVVLPDPRENKDI